VTRRLITPKVFGIGFHKTGTTSLADALTLLGYEVTGPNGVHLKGMDHETAWRCASRLLSRFDAFQDNPWPLLYRDIDIALPGSKFVLTIRQEDDWLGSVVRHFGSESTPMREWIYGEGAPLGHEAVFLERYRQHNREVADYFDGRPEDLLIIEITRGQGWNELCAFLGHKSPDLPFPHSNPAGDRSWTGRRMLHFRTWLSRHLSLADHR
jgi:hypothetical protein